MEKSTSKTSATGAMDIGPCVKGEESTKLDWQCIWEGRFGLIVIEVHDDRMFVNGYPVDLTRDATTQARPTGKVLSGSQEQPDHPELDACSESA
jgi:hypothetical protein